MTSSDSCLPVALPWGVELRNVMQCSAAVALMQTPELRLAISSTISNTRWDRQVIVQARLVDVRNPGVPHATRLIYNAGAAATTAARYANKVPAPVSVTLMNALFSDPPVRVSGVLLALVLS